MPDVAKHMVQVQEANAKNGMPPSLPVISKKTLPSKKGPSHQQPSQSLPSNQAAMVAELLQMHQQQQQQQQVSPSLSAVPAPQLTVSESLQFLLGAYSPPFAASSAPAQSAPLPPVDNSALLVQNALASLLGQQQQQANPFFLNQNNNNNGDPTINLLLGQLQASLQPNVPETSFLGHHQQLQPNDLLSSLLGLPNNNVAPQPAMFQQQQQQQDPLIAALNAQLQMLQRQQHQAPPPKLQHADLNSAMIFAALLQQK